MKALIFFCFAVAAALGGDLPNPKLTPGAVSPNVTVADLAVPGYAGRARNVSAATKRVVFVAYFGKVPANPGAYEIDHLISLELGGSNDIRNLWPQPYDGPNGAHVKDRIEGRLHWLVIHGKLPLAAAQHAIATDWIAAMKKYCAP